MPSNLNDFRQQLDTIDDQLIDLLAGRFKITRQIGQFKAQNDLPVQDKSREANQMEQIAAKAMAVDLDPAFAQRVLRVIIDQVITENQQITV